MDAAVNNNDSTDGNSHATEHSSHQQVQLGHSNESSEETFFDYSDVEEGDDEDGFRGDEINIDDRIENDLLGDAVNSRPHRLSHDFETTALDRHIQRMDWPAVLRRIKIYPQECSTVDITNGQTPLHVACHAGAPAVIVQSLCQAYPEASIRTDRCNMNPLHITCSSNSASLSTVHALLHHGSSEQISMRDVDGDTPLHAACRCGANKDVIDFLLQTYPDAVNVHDFEGFTPLVRLWVRYYVIFGESEIYNAIECPSKLETDVRFVTAWEQTLLLLQYAYHGCGTMLSSSGSLTTKPTSIYATSTSFRQQIRSNAQRLLSPSSSATTMDSMLETQQDQQSLFILHAVSAVDCPRFVVQLAIRKYPTQLFQRDEHGRSPLMVACAAPNHPYHNLSDDLLSWTHDNIEAEGNDDHDEEINVRLNNGPERGSLEDTESPQLFPESKSSVIELILHAGKSLAEFTPLSLEEIQVMKYGGADWVDPSGRLPLHIAIESGKTWNDGINALLKIYPDSIGIADRSTKLYPYQLAATKAVQNDRTSNDCYKLLRLNPTILSMGNAGSYSRSDINTSSSLTTILAVADDTDLFVPRTNDNDTSTSYNRNEGDESIHRKRQKI